MRPVFYGLFLLSGAAGLGYQIVWARAFALGLGHELPGVLAVVSAIFAGLSLGSLLLDRRIGSSRRPDLWYVALELLIGLWALATLALIPWAEGLTAGWIGLDTGPARHWSFAFAVPMVVLLPATFAMGATLPAMERLVFALEPGRHVGGLYAANCLGAVAGTLGAAYVALPTLGMRASVIGFAALNLLCAALAAALSRGWKERAAFEEARSRQASSRVALEGWGGGIRGLPFFWFATGCLGIAYESLGIRILSRVFENSIYSFAVVLSLYLTGTALGAAAYQRWARPRRVEPTLSRLLTAIAAGCGLGGVALYFEVAIYRAARGWLGDSPVGVASAELFVASLVFLVPTACMGATFSHLVQAARRRDGGVGRSAALNTLGAATAPPLVGVLLLPMFGAPLVLAAIVGGYLMLARRFAATAALVLLCLLRPTSLPQELHRDSEILLAWREGALASVAVVETAESERRLRVNGRFQMGGTGGGILGSRQGLLPLMLHEAPRSAAFLGVATGATMKGALEHPGVDLTGVELLPEVLDMLPLFEETGAVVQRSPRVELVVADARRFVRTSPEQFDVIVGDLFHPGRDGAGTLYTLEHFQAIRDRLDPDGLFCQWLPLYQLDEPTLQSIAATFLSVFPEAWAFVGDFGIDTPVAGLVGTRRGALEIPSDRWNRDPSELPARSVMERHRLDSAVSLAGSALASPAQLRAFAGEAPIARDDLPLVVYRAPLFTAKRDSVPHGRLLAWIERVGTARPDGLIPPNEADRAALVARTRRFIEARDGYLRGLVLADEGDGRSAMVALWDSHERSADFEEVRRHLGRIADAVEPRAPSQARAIRQRLGAWPQRGTTHE